MEGRILSVMFMTLVLAAMPNGSPAQTTHVVGDSLGWLVPPGGEVAYRTWAASRTFSMGDILVFNFSTGTHDVAEVSRAAYDSCNSSSPIATSTNGPTNITLTSAGEHHFICTFNRHCDLGQKLAINVSGVAAPAPQPTTPPTSTPETAPSPAVPANPPPAVTPAPSPSSVRMTYTVGDSLGWVVPPGGPIAYQTWVRGKRFMVGDTLVFNFTTGAHDVLKVTRAEFDSCSISTTAITPTTTSPARITLASTGEHYYICSFPQHCSFGQKLAINVTTGGSTGRPSSGPAPAPSSTATPPPSSATLPPSSSGPTTATPFTPSTPSPATAPPPPSNSAPSLVAAALPFSLLVVAITFLYN